MDGVGVAECEVDGVGVAECEMDGVGVAECEVDGVGVADSEMDGVGVGVGSGEGAASESSMLVSCQLDALAVTTVAQKDMAPSPEKDGAVHESVMDVFAVLLECETWYAQFAEFMALVPAERVPLRVVDEVLVAPRRNSITAPLNVPPASVMV
jgi:hypothetical protein